MERLDVFNWKEVKNGETFRGVMHLRASAQIAAYISVEGYEVLAGAGTEIHVRFQGEGVLRVEAPQGVTVWAHQLSAVTFEPNGEVYMNVDRKPHESAAMQEVKRALRELEIGKRSALAEITAASRAAKQERKALKRAKTAVEREADAEAVRLAQELEAAQSIPDDDSAA